jgi:ParB family chromosome partitioning protein
MSRKNVFDLDTDNAVGVESSPRVLVERPLLGLDRPPRQAAPLGAISQSLGTINVKVRNAERIEKALAEGLTVVELDPGTIDRSFVADRMEIPEDQRRAFVDAIRENGQQVPILVRPKPGQSGRFEVAYGHRRLAAAIELGRPVRAVVRDLSDVELVVAQGQENSARTDLTFIERARFAARLEERKFTRDTIMAALSVDKAALSRLIALAGRVPPDIVEAIGPAPGYGRIKWQELTELLDNDKSLCRARSVVQEAAFRASSSDRRFETLHAALRADAARSRPEQWTAPDGARAARIMRGGGRLTLSFDHKAAPEFGEFVTGKLGALYEEYASRSRGPEDKEGGGDTPSPLVKPRSGGR